MATAFRLTTAPLTGRNLVEASAGTGKTYSLAGLFLRLVVEAGLGVDEILVVTFTEAATEELRGRIRARLREAQEALRSGDPGGDVLLTHLLAHPDVPRERALGRLTAALRCFDDAAISTIHGFCQRVLAERAFECGVALGAELLPDPSALLEELVADHWRQRLHGASTGFARHVAAQHQGLADLAGAVRTWAGRSHLTVVPKITGADADPAGAEALARARFDAVAELWRVHREEVVDLLARDPALGHGKLSQSSVAKMADALEAYLAGDDLLVPVKWIERFGREFLAAETRPGGETPGHPLLDACQSLLEARADLAEAYRRAWIGFRGQLLAFAEAELPARKARQGVRTFDDLLREVHRALTGPGGERLAEALRNRYRAALIDEFQDTDPLQYEIFQRVFAAAPEPRLFLIGDPKQAIYGFRGADLFAYLGAARAVDARFTLVENWRSTPDLLAAVERLYTRGASPFVLEGIDFVPVAPGGGGKPPLVLDGAADPEPLQVWWIDAAPGGGLPAKKRVIPDLCQATAAEVLRLVTAGQAGQATIAGVPLEPGQVAVLVRTHDQARGVQQALTARRIPSVIASGESLFASAEAREMLAFLGAVAEPTRGGRVRAALATELVGLSAGELHALRDDERRWEAWLERFRQIHDLWAGRGLVAALRGALAELGVRERFLAYPDGERRVTNVLHLVELLHTAAEAGQLGPEAVVGWLGRRVADREEAEEYQLRLETDEKAVQVVTVHRSKGLEYPVVLCPFLWEGLRDDPDDDAVACHDPADPARMVLDLGSTDHDRHRALARWEALAERVRLAYVALTRARQRCYLAWGAVNRGEDAALGYLLHAPDGVRTAAPEALVGELVASAKTGRDRYRAELATLAAGSGGALRVTEAPQPPPAGVVF
ncbi:MAG: UvrD-helicase domain-containing protein, partial [Deferrisomatales bacterium]|nr:UvrD-helicase domain-containing protein [Deferrisomatales bacterium]